MNCIDCRIHISQSYCACKEILDLMNGLDVPAQEQITLFNMAVKHMSCNMLREVLCSLTNRENKINKLTAYAY